MKPKINVCIAEDHALIRNSLIEFLNNNDDINVMFGAMHGIELLEQLEFNIPDVIILDIEMPVMDGIEALKIIRVKYPQIKIIMYSSNYTASSIRECIGMGAVGYLSKFADRSEIISTILAVNNFGFYYSEYVSKVLST
jgi:DNA-binding NarL/FixJ family response regulator